MMKIAGDDSRLWMLPVVALLAFVSTSAAWLDAFSSPTPAEFQRNYERWLELSAAERGEIKERWEAWQSLEEEQQELLKTRMLTVKRVRESYSEEHQVDVTDAKLSDEVERLVALARRSVEEHDADPADVRRALNHRSRKLALAYIGDLVVLGRLAPERMAAIEALDTQQIVSRALTLAKDEAVAAARAARLKNPEEEADPEELEILEPLEVIRRVDRARRLFGFHGPAGRTIFARMGEEEQTALRAASTEGQERDVHRLLLPYVHELAKELGVPDERLDAFTSMPRGAIERHLNALIEQR